MAVALKSLILTEGAGAARALKKLTGSAFAVVSTDGPIRDLPRSRIGIDAENGYAPDYITVRGKGQLLKELKLKTMKARRIFLATTPDAAGEFLARQYCDLFGVNKQSNCRVIIDELSKPAVRAALDNARPIDENLADAFQTRQIIDKFISHRLGEYLECKVYRGVKVGRLRALLLKLIAAAKFPPTLTIRPPLNLATLQELALARLNFSTAKTRLTAAQLFEGFEGFGGLIKFPRGLIELSAAKFAPEVVRATLTENQFKLYELIFAEVNSGAEVELAATGGLAVLAALNDLGVDWAEFYSISINSLLKRGYVAPDLTVTALGEKVLNALDGYFDEILSVDTYNAIAADLAAVAAGTAEKNAVVAKYCAAFSENFSAAMASLGESANPKDEPCDEICDKCGRPMVVKHGRYGKFLACSGYPECKNIKPHVDYLASKCPKCGGRLTRQNFRGGRNFYACEHAPECDFRTWDDPLENPCRECGSTMFVHKFRGRAPMVYCGNANCTTRSSHPINDIIAAADRRREARQKLKDSGDSQ